MSSGGTLGPGLPQPGCPGSTSDPLSVFGSRCVCLPAVYAGRFCTSFHWGGLYQCESSEEGGGGASGGEATLVFAPRRVGIQSGPSRSRRKVHRITSYVCFGLKQTSSTTFIPAPPKNPTNSSAPSCLLIDRSIFSFAPAGESREKRKKKKSTTPGETEREEEKARRKTQEVEAREEKVI